MTDTGHTPICPHCGGALTTGFVTIAAALEGLNMAERAYAERDRLREVNAELLKELHSVCEELELFAAKEGMPVESAAPKADSDAGAYGAAQALRDARAAIVRAEKELTP